MALGYGLPPCNNYSRTLHQVSLFSQVHVLVKGEALCFCSLSQQVWMLQMPQILPTAPARTRRTLVFTTSLSK